MGEWYEKAVIYQIYPKSFKDSNNDGVGDLPGITEKLDYVQQLGANTIWLNPIFVSPQIDNGYDVSNYFAIDPILGNIDDFQQMVTEIHKRNMYLILDLPINDTSDQHPWFQDAVKNKESIFRDYYIWGENNGKRPNNWGSFFGGSMWEPDPNGGSQYYCHLFDKKMPDLNWENPEVRKSMADIANFWIDKGVDGFRLDAFIHIAKANFEQNILNQDEKFPIDSSLYANLPNVKTNLQNFIKLVKNDHPDAFFLGEASSADAYQAAEYTRPDQPGCDMVVTSDNYGEIYPTKDPQIPKFFQPRQLDAEKLKDTFSVWEAVLKNISLPALTWGNHDISRVLDRLNISEDNLDMPKALAVVMYLQRGIPIIYYGEEIGMRNLKYKKLKDFHDQRALDLIQLLQNLDYPDEEILQLLNQQDEMTARGPFQWQVGKYVGFSNHHPWNWADHNAVTAESSIADSEGLLAFYQAVLKIKKLPLFSEGSYVLLDTERDVYAYKRELDGIKGFVVVNLGDKSVTYHIPTIKIIHTILSNKANSLVDNVVTMDAGGSIVLTEK
ncbi:Oligo-1,6-glucosidase [Pediococcus damnosus]|uniref:Oligo-1,6-glucosidase n=1 Tax=Pediococcus damnosus TaxID=51663 RepID=A0A143AFV9_9LACO|nr:alpha-glucosidase [Pediococcus damnosus]AMV62761.1 Oligo-1,6-glucosidase [Pediococcus damnosus]AMV67355.1 Oligo-1,6-glucosidase [Pediococcus damnosus]KJU75173.1 alpha,alpha-phosphotrehalase [Pediococcus damnosus LMG 28219]PIO81382.1 alpha-glucosidase [Pediococcus damnosus]PIO85078.1 alpha-glucosidase [Pediococcus damnosus]